METVAFLGLLGLGYVASTYNKKEGFENQRPPSTKVNDKERTPRETATIPGKPRTPSYFGSGGYDTQFELPANGYLPAEPNPDPIQGPPIEYATRKEEKRTVPTNTLPQQFDKTTGYASLQLRTDGWEDETDRPAFISPLSGIEFKPGEFKHANMVPFAKKFTQNLVDTANNQTLDNYTGSGKTMFAKKEQSPFFEPTKEPMGNPFGLESSTDFMQGRQVEPRLRQGERPVEPIRVGPGLNAGYTHLPSGGFQQQEGEDYVQRRMPRTNDLRVATNPKLTYMTPVVPGSHYITNSGSTDTVGEVRRYRPDTFFINENGERNFVTTGADTKPAIRSAQVVKHTTRPETTKEYGGVAGQTEGKATYTVGSMRTPLVKQLGTWGFRNADLTDNFNKNTDADGNDYGKSGVEILPNERYYTGERVHATNLKPDAREVELPLQDVARQTRAEELIDNPRTSANFSALGNGVAEKPTVYDPNDPLRTTIKETTIDNDWLGMAAPTDAQPKLTVYDPNDSLRTTVKETTIDNDWIGMAAPTDAQPKLTVYDPNDVARTTIRETTEDNDYLGIGAPADRAQKLTVYDPDDIARVTGRNTLDSYQLFRNFGLQDTPGKAETRLQDPVRPTQKSAISAKSSWAGPAVANEPRETNRTAARNMRTYAQRENISRGRNPMGSSVKVFNGEDYTNLQYRRIIVDSVNDREPGQDRVNSVPLSTDVIGVQRPRSVLKLDVANDRNAPVIVKSLEANPYVIPLHKAAKVGGKNTI